MPLNLPLMKGRLISMPSMLPERSVDNLALTGFMGVGKSTLGRHLASSMKYRFVDTDRLIEQRVGKNISTIFKQEGEERFRLLEHELVEEMACWKRVVIATGGGLITRHNNLQSLKRYAFVVCLWASPQTIYGRVKGGRHRPLLQNDNPLESIRRLLTERASFYKRADCIISIDNRSMRLIAQIVSQQYFQAFCKKKSSEKNPLTCNLQPASKRKS